MTDNAAYIISQSVAALIEAMGMHADNMQRESQGYSMAYDLTAFMSLIEKYGLDHNSVVKLMEIEGVR